MKILSWKNRLGGAMQILGFLLLAVGFLPAQTGKTFWILAAGLALNVVGAFASCLWADACEQAEQPELLPRAVEPKSDGPRK